MPRVARRSRRHGQRAAVPGAPGPEWAGAALAAAGLLIAGYLAVNKLTHGTALFCQGGGGCDIVQSSRYATFLGVPTALWGVVGYLAIGALAMIGLTAQRWLAAFLLAVGAASFSGYLTWISAFEIRALCGWCLASGVAALALFGLLLYRRPAPGGARSPVRTTRVVTLAVASAVLTVGVGVGVFAAGAPTAEGAYREALARHLTATGAVMYGAFW